MIDEIDNFLPDYDDDYERDRINGDEEREESCCMPGCLMPGPHLRSECHDVAMIESYNYRSEDCHEQETLHGPAGPAFRGVAIAVQWGWRLLSPAAIGELLDHDAENENRHDFVGCHVKLALILATEVGKEKAIVILRKIVDAGGLYGMNQ